MSKRRFIIGRILIVTAVLLVMMTVGVYAARTFAPLKAADMRLYVDEDTTLKLGADTEAMFEAVGTDYTVERLPSCLFEGEDHVYYYDGLTVYTHPEDDKQIIDEMQITGQQYPTRRGVWVGTPVATVIDRYGRRYEKSDDTMSYFITKQMRIIFTIENGVVAKYSLYNVPIG